MLCYSHHHLISGYTMSKLTDDIKRMLNALAFADAGEYLTLPQKDRFLKRGTGVEITPVTTVQAAPSTRPRQQVALYMGSELPADIMQYVMQTCARLKHGLTVLTFQPDSTADTLLAPYADALKSEDIAMQVVTLSGDPVSGLARYLRRHPEVTFLACNETGYLGRSFLNGSQRQDALPVPVVLVASHKEGMQNMGHAQPGQDTANVRAA